MYFLFAAQKSEYPILLEIWESSVRATHHFLKPGDIEFYKRTIQDNRIFELVDLTVVKDSMNTIVGFMGVSADAIEMIFVDPKFMGKGVGRMLLEYAIKILNKNKVDVNEQNTNAIKVYEHFGFRVISRSALDESGKQYPILHMQLHI